MSRSWTPEQAELFESAGGALKLPRVAVGADAGAGKTSVLVERVRRLPSEMRVLCVSFTEKSKADLETRLDAHLNAEVYTIHGFCSRVVAEFGARLGLPPFMRVMDADEREELLYRAFEKVYRRAPPKNAELRVENVWAVCRLACEVGEGARVHDFANGSLASDDGDLARFAAEVAAEFAGTKRLLRVLEYSDLETYAAAALREPEVAASLRQRYGHVFVDEFQDTSRLQCELVDALTGREGQLFVVGDQKQSIYRFRGADVEVFKDYVKRLPAQRRLSSNFRSHPDIITAVNDVCAPIIDDYEQMVAGRTPERGELEPAIFESLPRVARVTAETDADAIEAVLRQLRARGVDWSKIVLLVRRIKGNDELFKDLMSRGVGLAITSSTSASTNEELKVLLNLWIWACEPWQKLRAAQVVTDFGLASRADLDTAIADLNLGWTEARAAAPRTSCEELLALLGRRFDLAARFGAVFEQFEVFVLRHQSEGLSPAALARRLHDLLAHDQDITGFVLLPPPANLTGTIRVLTVHGSKGLEFPVVLLADVGKRRSRVTGVLKRGDDIWLPGRTEDGSKPDWSPPELDNAKALEAEAETAESARLLYVAMTRAQEALYVADRAPDPEAAEKKTKKAPAPDTSWSAWLKAGVRATVPAEVFADGTPALPSATGAAQVARSEPLAPEKPVYRRARVGVAALAAETGPDHRTTPSRPHSPAAPSLYEGDVRELGTEIHRHFELEDWEGLAKAARDTGLDLTAFNRWLETPAARAVFGPGVRARNEFAFEWRNQAAVVTGRIDRLVLADPSEAWVIDYKVMRGSRETGELLARYGPQLRLYAEAVKKLTKCGRVRAFILDVTAASGSVWNEIV